MKHDFFAFAEAGGQGSSAMPRAFRQRPTIGELAASPEILVRLALARIALGRLGASDIPRRNASAARRAARCSSLRADVCAIAARLVPALAARVPWRSDCLVQALAAQGWLAARGVAGRIELGIDRDATGILPHAWLRAGDRIVTGGTIDRYTVLLGDETATLSHINSRQR